jgi:hypothetical protein
LLNHLALQVPASRWRELMGVTDTEVRTWRSAEPDEDF